MFDEVEEHPAYGLAGFSRAEVLKKPPERRIKTMLISDGLLISVLSGKAKVTNLPDGVEIIRGHYNFQAAAVEVMLRSDTFDVVDDWCHPPAFQAFMEVVPKEKPMAELPKYAIMYGDCPSRVMIAQRVGEKFRYMCPRKGERRKLMNPPTVAGCGPTDIKLFGFSTVETQHSVRFERVCESSAKYADGKPRLWQDRTFGANIGDSFEIPKRKR